jgi:hypothetical protein
MGALNADQNFEAVDLEGRGPETVSQLGSFGLVLAASLLKIAVLRHSLPRNRLAMRASTYSQVRD